MLILKEIKSTRNVFCYSLVKRQKIDQTSMISSIEKQTPKGRNAKKILNDHTLNRSLDGKGRY